MVGPDSHFPAEPQTPGQELPGTHVHTRTHARARRGKSVQGRGPPAGSAGTHEHTGTLELVDPVSTQRRARTCARTRPFEVQHRSLCPASPEAARCGQQPSPACWLAGPHLTPPLSCRLTSRRTWIWPVDQVSACQVRATGGPRLGPLSSFSFLCVSVYSFVCPHPTSACHSPHGEVGSDPPRWWGCCPEGLVCTGPAPPPPAWARTSHFLPPRPQP